MLQNKPYERHFRNALQASLIISALLFSFYIMFHTFSFDAKKQEMVLASKVWSDFGAHIPLIRSFSYGPNLTRLLLVRPVESPLFPGEPIRYHFGFYALVGLLERMGVRIDWALNIPSALGFFFLLLSIFLLSYLLFTNYYLSFLSVVFFLFNGSLSFLTYFTDHPLSPASLGAMLTNSKFTSFGPWDGGIITAFWNLNIFTNQRHLGLSYALVVAIILMLYKKSRKTTHIGLYIGFCLSALLFINFAAAGIAGVFCLWFFLIKPSIRASMGIALFVTLPSLLFLRSVSTPASSVMWDPGYLIQDPLTPASFIRFWLDNLGLHILFIPLGVMLAPHPVRRMVAPPLLILFILPNLFRFSPDMINNHKFFNFFLIIGNMFSAYAITVFLKKYDTIPLKYIRKPLCAIFAVVVIGSLTLSGFIDFFPIIHDYKGKIADIRSNPDADFIRTSARPDDTVANSTWFYHPASIAGRSLYSGYTYFTWSYGYDQTSREAALKSIYEAPDLPALCSILAATSVPLVELNSKPESYLHPNWQLWNSLIPAYENPGTHLRIYKSADICANIPL